MAVDGNMTPRKRGNRSEVTETGWDLGRYYTRSKKVNRRVEREYIGAGPVADLAAQLDALDRQERLFAALSLRNEKAALTTFDADLKALIRITDLVARAALVAAGYRQHKRGEWRKQREPDDRLG